MSVVQPVLPSRRLEIPDEGKGGDSGEEEEAVVKVKRQAGVHKNSRGWFVECAGKLAAGFGPFNGRTVLRGDRQTPAICECPRAGVVESGARKIQGVNTVLVTIVQKNESEQIAVSIYLFVHDCCRKRDFRKGLILSSLAGMPSS